VRDPPPADADGRDAVGSHHKGSRRRHVGGEKHGCYRSTSAEAGDGTWRKGLFRVCRRLMDRCSSDVEPGRSMPESDWQCAANAAGCSFTRDSGFAR